MLSPGNFKVPLTLTMKKELIVRFKGLPEFRWSDLEEQDVVGQGSFEQFVWFSIVVVKNLKLDLSGVYLLRLIVSQRRCANTGDNAKFDQLIIGT